MLLYVDVTKVLQAGTAFFTTLTSAGGTFTTLTSTGAAFTALTTDSITATSGQCVSLSTTGLTVAGAVSAANGQFTTLTSGTLSATGYVYGNYASITNNVYAKLASLTSCTVSGSLTTAYLTASVSALSHAVCLVRVRSARSRARPCSPPMHSRPPALL